MKRHLRIPLLLIVLALLHVSVLAQKIPSPQDVLGFRPGDDKKLADWKQITDYFTKLSQASPRITLRELGKTTNGNPFLLATITAPENQKKLDRYREIQHKLADPRLVSSDAEVDRLIEEGKNVVVISCSIHSTEIVASQMSMELAYKLASDNSDDTKDILNNTIILMFPSMNPDGIDIVSHWYQKTLGTPYEGSNPPELYHHYAGHDDNRDWYMLNLAETQLATKLFYKEWYPEIFYDIHQQGSFGSRMFVPPFFDPPNPNIDSVLLRSVAMIGEHMSADLAEAGYKGISTFSTYDTWWHGGFRTAPYYHNAVGILTEAASSRIATPIEVTRDDLAKSNTRGLGNAVNRSTNFPDVWPGGIWRNSDIRDMEMVTAWSLLKLSARYRKEWMRNFYNLGKKQLDLGKTEGPYAYVVPPDQRDSRNVTHMVRILEEQGVEVHRAKKEFNLDGQTYASGTYIVPMNQPYRANVKTLFEAQEYPNRLLANGEAERPYDVAGWTLPMMMGVNYAVVNKPLDPSIIGDEVKAPSRDDKVQERASAKRVGLYQSWNASMDEGWTRYVLEHFTLQDGINVKFNYTSVHNNDIRGGNLRDKFDVIILP
ncbi:MAG TPA: M14 metallopeptidase family protein, partial [Blastocatellia bacterium]|nr:M14 metallopeptidase family protein [Blastocatellia bacterium]